VSPTPRPKSTPNDDTSSASVSSHSPSFEPSSRRRASSPSTQSIAAPSHKRIPASVVASATPRAARIAAVTPHAIATSVTWFGVTGVRTRNRDSAREIGRMK